MTAPVLTNIIPGQDKPCEDDYTMSFYVDPVEGEAPNPTEATVRLTEQPKQKVYVRYVKISILYILFSCVFAILI